MTEFDKINHLQQIIDKQEAEIKELKAQIKFILFNLVENWRTK